MIDNDGFAEFYIYSNQAGSQNLTASIAGVTDTDSATKTWGSLGARNISLTTIGGNTAEPGTTHQVKATVTDRLGNPVAGVPVTFTESGPGRFLNGTSTEPSSVTANTGADGTVTVELTTQPTESGVETIRASLPTTGGTDECERAAGDPSGAPAGTCQSNAVTINWTNAPTGAPFEITSPVNYYTTVAGNTVVSFAGHGAQPGEVLKVYRKVGNETSYSLLPGGPTVRSDGTWAYNLKVTTTTSVFFQGAKGQTGNRVIKTTPRIISPKTYYTVVTKGQAVTIYGAGARPNEQIYVFKKVGSGQYVKSLGPISTSYGTWAYRTNITANNTAFYFRSVAGQTQPAVFKFA